MSLFTYEVVCPTCLGGSPLREGCETCDGCGIIVNDRRAAPRTSIADDFTKLRNERNAALAELDENRELLRVAMGVLEGYRDWIADLADRQIIFKSERPGN